jgi:hypothetical protein
MLFARRDDPSDELLRDTVQACQNQNAFPNCRSLKRTTYDYYLPPVQQSAAACTAEQPSCHSN